jgi:hypothetical protein
MPLPDYNQLSSLRSAFKCFMSIEVSAQLIWLSAIASEMLLKPEASDAGQGVYGQDWTDWENEGKYVRKIARKPLYSHKSLISRIGAGNENRTRIF